MIKIGPTGSNVGKAWDEKGLSELCQIFISYGSYIKSIQFQYVENGTSVLSEKYGCNGSNFSVVQLNYPSEYITWVSGKTDGYSGGLTSLTFGTNQGTHGPFGSDGSRPAVSEFNYQLGRDRQLGGFFGTHGSYGINSIGVYLKPRTSVGTNHPRLAQLAKDLASSVSQGLTSEFDNPHYDKK